MYTLTTIFARVCLNDFLYTLRTSKYSKERSQKICNYSINHLKYLDVKAPNMFKLLNEMKARLTWSLRHWSVSVYCRAKTETGTNRFFLINRLIPFFSVRHNVVRTKKYATRRSRLAWLLFPPHFDVFCTSIRVHKHGKNGIYLFYMIFIETFQPIRARVRFYDAIYVHVL